MEGVAHCVSLLWGCACVCCQQSIHLSVIHNFEFAPANSRTEGASVMGLLSLIRKLKLKGSPFVASIAHAQDGSQTTRAEKEMRLLILGLDNAGKTTVVKRFNGEDISTIAPTLGFNIVTLAYHDYKLTCWDIGGQKSIRAFWRNYFEQTDGLVWVVDSSDMARLLDCRDELLKLLKVRHSVCIICACVHCQNTRLIIYCAVLAGGASCWRDTAGVCQQAGSARRRNG